MNAYSCRVFTWASKTDQLQQRRRKVLKRHICMPCYESVPRKLLGTRRQRNFPLRERLLPPRQIKKQVVGEQSQACHNIRIASIFLDMLSVMQERLECVNPNRCDGGQIDMLTRRVCRERSISPINRFSASQLK